MQFVLCCIDTNEKRNGATVFVIPNNSSGAMRHFCSLSICHLVQSVRSASNGFYSLPTIAHSNAVAVTLSSQIDADTDVRMESNRTDTINSTAGATISCLRRNYGWNACRTSSETVERVPNSFVRFVFFALSLARHIILYLHL